MPNLPPIEVYKQLVAQLQKQGFFKCAYGYYALYSLLVVIGTIISFYVMIATDLLWVQVLNALFLAFVSVQAGMLGHDCSHLQVFRSERVNRFWGKFLWGFFCGLSEEKWYQKHNDHHVHVNHDGLDPDLDMPFIFSEVQLETSNIFVRKFIVPHQHVIFFFLLPFVYLSMSLWTWRYLLSKITWTTIFEFVLIVIHFVFYGVFIFYFLPFGTALIFVVVWLGIVGVYMSAVFAPNHKGKEVFAHDEEEHWTHQITATRNIYPSWLVFHMTGGLNFQIEHHLFPRMPRIHYWLAQPAVKKMCQQYSLEYYETTFIQSVKEIYLALKKARPR